MAPPAPFLYARSSGDGTSQDAALRAAFEGDLQRLRGTVKSLVDPRVVFSFQMGGLGVLHHAACGGHLEVCKYCECSCSWSWRGHFCQFCLDFAGVTPFMTAAQSGDVSTVKYLLDCGGDVTKADGKGRTVLHHAACNGSCKVTEFLLSKGVPVDIDCGRGTPLHQAATNEKDKTVKILLEHHADPNTTVTGLGTALMGALLYRSLKCMKLLIKAGADVNRMNSLLVTPLVFATVHKGYTNFVEFLLKAGADPNILDAVWSMLPVEHAARRDCREEVEMLFPLTSPIPTIPNWSIDGIISHAKFESAKPLDQSHHERAKAIMTSQADHAFRLKDYKLASIYALRCRMLQPNWAKACCRQAAAHMLLKEYKQACDALLDAQKLDPGNTEVERELRKARELMRAHGEADK
ncbi:hypothetical protein ZWY2020_012628 [Hordeum vulgare]|nr:hypothetical protein ZWY2020_012628 [Hordeum vulgare]